MAVEKYEGEKKLLTGASGDLSRPRRKRRTFAAGATARGSKVGEIANLKFEISDRDKAKSRSPLVRLHRKTGPQSSRRLRDDSERDDGGASRAQGPAKSRP